MAYSFKPVRAYFSQDKNLTETIKNIFGFYPDNIFLYKLALTHKSGESQLIRGNKSSNERLEYLGDAILDAIVADFLYKIYPFKDEGFLTEMRSKLVSRNTLNKLALKLGIDNIVECSRDGKNHFQFIYGDAFEALVGAIYLDKGYRFSQNIIINNILKIHVDIDNLENIDINYKSKLLEWAQKEKKEIEFKVAKEEEINNIKQYHVALFIEGKPVIQSIGNTIKGAEKLAAEKAYLLYDLVE